MIISEYEQIAAREAYGANDIRPGLSGWAQVNGRDTLDIETKARYDGWYRAHMSIMLDIRIIAQSFFTLFTQSGYMTKGQGEGCEDEL